MVLGMSGVLTINPVHLCRLNKKKTERGHRKALPEMTRRGRQSDRDLTNHNAKSDKSVLVIFL